MADVADIPREAAQIVTGLIILLLTALGGALRHRASAFNIALKGKMLIGAFFAVVGANYTGH